METGAGCLETKRKSQSRPAGEELWTAREEQGHKARTDGPGTAVQSPLGEAALIPDAGVTLCGTVGTEDPDCGDVSESCLSTNDETVKRGRSWHAISR